MIHMLKAIAIDDEPKALDIVKLHAQKIPFINLLQVFRDPLDAVSWLQDNPTDLLFLDINMPKLSGLKFRSFLGETSMIIFTTAYSEYAAESYELNAIDYLLKPISFERFLQASLKAKERYAHFAVKERTPITELSNAEQRIYIKSGTKHYQISISDILYLEKDGNYLIFHTKEQKILARLNMSQALDLLPDEAFQKVHKSYIVPLDKINMIDTYEITIGSKKIPLAKSYREALFNRIRPL